MATVPTTPVSTVNPVSGPTARLSSQSISARSFGADAGAALADAGGAIAGAGDALGKIALDEQNRINAVDRARISEEFESQAQENYLTILNSGDLTKKETVQEFNAALGQLRQQMISSHVGGERSMQELDVTLGQTAYAFSDKLNVHAFEAQKKQVNRQLNNSINRLGARAQTQPSQLNNLLEEGLEKIENMSDALTANEKAVAEDALNSVVYEGAINGFLDNLDINMAEMWMRDSAIVGALGPEATRRVLSRINTQRANRVKFMQDLRKLDYKAGIDRNATLFEYKLRADLAKFEAELEAKTDKNLPSDVRKLNYITRLTLDWRDGKLSPSDTSKLINVVTDHINPKPIGPEGLPFRGQVTPQIAEIFWNKAGILIPEDAISTLAITGPQGQPQPGTIIDQRGPESFPVEGQVQQVPGGVAQGGTTFDQARQQRTSPGITSRDDLSNQFSAGKQAPGNVAQPESVGSRAIKGQTTGLKAAIGDIISRTPGLGPETAFLRGVQQAQSFVPVVSKTLEEGLAQSEHFSPSELEDIRKDLVKLEGKLLDTPEAYVNRLYGLYDGLLVRLGSIRKFQGNPQTTRTQRANADKAVTAIVNFMEAVLPNRLDIYQESEKDMLNRALKLPAGSLFFYKDKRAGGEGAPQARVRTQNGFSNKLIQYGGPQQSGSLEGSEGEEVLTGGTGEDEVPNTPDDTVIEGQTGEMVLAPDDIAAISSGNFEQHMEQKYGPNWREERTIGTPGGGTPNPKTGRQGFFAGPAGVGVAAAAQAAEAAADFGGGDAGSQTVDLNNPHPNVGTGEIAAITNALSGPSSAQSSAPDLSGPVSGATQAPVTHATISQPSNIAAITGTTGLTPGGFAIGQQIGTFGEVEAGINPGIDVNNPTGPSAAQTALGPTGGFAINPPGLSSFGKPTGALGAFSSTPPASTLSISGTPQGLGAEIQNANVAPISRGNEGISTPSTPATPQTPVPGTKPTQPTTPQAPTSSAQLAQTPEVQAIAASSVNTAFGTLGPTFSQDPNVVSAVAVAGVNSATLGPTNPETLASVEAAKGAVIGSISQNNLSPANIDEQGVNQAVSAAVANVANQVSSQQQGGVSPTSTAQTGPTPQGSIDLSTAISNPGGFAQQMTNATDQQLAETANQITEAINTINNDPLSKDDPIATESVHNLEASLSAISQEQAARSEQGISPEL